jgi:hypothetical protein
VNVQAVRIGSQKVWGLFTGYGRTIGVKLFTQGVPAGQTG